MREKKQTDFIVEVEGVGTVTFARRTRRDNYTINSEFFRLTGGTEPPNDSGLGFVAFAEATVKTLLVEAPNEFLQLLDLDNADAFDVGIEEKIVDAFLALRQKEQQFRQKPDETSKTES